MVESKPNGTPNKSAMRLTADKLRKMVMKHQDGDFLGSESDLIAKLEISRPTFRQVAKLLEQEQLITIRRGVGGGFFARRPSPRAVAHMAAIFLRTRGATQSHAILAAMPIFVECAQLAARTTQPEIRERLEVLLERERVIQGNDLTDFVRRERELALIVAEAAGNPVLGLFITVLADFFSSFEEHAYIGHSERVEIMRRLRLSMLQALFDGDAEVAKIIAHRRYNHLIEWLSDEHRVDPLESSVALA